jgi:DNA-binding NarL/FixJ family response regulator
MPEFKILIVEDEVFIAEDIKFTLEKLGYEVCSVCYDSEKAAAELYRCVPDLVMLDITIRGHKDGIQLAEMINEIHHIPFIYLTSHSDRDTLERAKHTRPRGYIVKPFKDRDLISSIEIALFNHSEDLKKKDLAKSVVDNAAKQPLSDQEYEIFIDLVEGLNNRQIGERRHLSINTIKTYIKRIFDKLEVHDRVSAIRKVIS